MAYPEQLPLRRLARVREHRADAQCLPKLTQTSQNGGLRELAPQRLPGLRSAEHAFFVQRLPQLEHQGRDLVPGRFLRRMLPIRIGAQAKHVGQRLAVGQKIRLLAHPAEQVQSDHTAGGDQARQQSLRLLDGGHAGCRLRAAYAGFDKGRRGRRQLCTSRQIQAQRMLFQPSLCVFEGEEGTLFLAPVRRSCCLELLCCQDGSALSKLEECR